MERIWQEFNMNFIDINLTESLNKILISLDLTFIVPFIFDEFAFNKKKKWSQLAWKIASKNFRL
jgi:hypothetical protein